MANQKQLEIVVKVKDLISGGLKSIQAQITNFAAGVGNAFKSATSAVFSLRGALIGLGAGAAAKAIVDAAASIEDYRSALVALVGDQERANAVVARMREFALQTPTATNALIESFTELQTSGVANAEDVVRRLAGISDRINADFEKLSDSFRTLQTRQLRQFGIELERAGGVAKLKFQENGREVVKTVRDTTSEIQRGLLEVLERKFPEAAGDAANTFKEKMQLFRNSINEVAAAIGEVFLPMLGDALTALTNLINENRDRIVALFKSIPEIWAVVVDFLKQKAREFFEGGFFRNEALSNAFLALMTAILRLFSNTLISLSLMVVEAAKQLWKPLLLEFVKLSQDIAIQFAKLYDATFGALANKITGTSDSLAAHLKQEFAITNDFLADEFKVNFDEAMAAFSKRSQETLAVLQEDLRNVGEAAKQLGTELGVDGLLGDIEQVVERNEAAIKRTREELNRLRQDAAGAAGGDKDKKKGGFFDGLSEGIETATVKLGDLKAVGRDVGQMFTNELTRAFDDTFNALIDGTFEAKKAFEDFGRAVLRAISQIIAQQLAMFVIQTTMKAAGGFLGFEKGGVMPGEMIGSMPVRRYDQGGVARSPQVAVFGEGRQAEAFVPLPDGRSIPVQFKDGQQGGGNTYNTLIIQAWDAADVQRNSGVIMQTFMDGLRRNSPVRQAVKEAMR